MRHIPDGSAFKEHLARSRVFRSPDGRITVASGKAGDDVRPGTYRAILMARLEHGGGVNAVAFSPDGRCVVSGSGDHTARVWEASSGKEVARLEHGAGVTAVAFSPDGRWVVSGSDDHTGRVWEAAGGKEVARLEHGDAVTAVAFSPDGRWVATASGNICAIHALRPEDLLEELRTRLTRNFTPEEWRRCLGDEPYRKTFASLP